MKTKELVERVWEHGICNEEVRDVPLTKAVVTKIIEAFQKELANVLIIDNEECTIKGLGAFKPSKQKASKRFNPRTREKVMVPEKRVIRFKVYPTVKAALNGGKDGEDKH